MTTIVCDGKSMAGDGQAEACHTIISHERVKVRRLSDGSLFGMAGAGGNADPLAEWLIDGGKKPKMIGSLSALRLFPDGRIFYLSESLDPTEITTPAAVGSGMDFAIGAMEAGAGIMDAVLIACRRDPGSGGKITVLFLDEQPALQAVA